MIVVWPSHHPFIEFDLFVTIKSISSQYILLLLIEKHSKEILSYFFLNNLHCASKSPSNLPENSIFKTKSTVNENKDIFWIIDPIDGTTNFLHGIPHFAISLALKKKDKIIIGLIFDPIKNEIFYAEKDSGSYFNNNRIRDPINNTK